MSLKLFSPNNIRSHYFFLAEIDTNEINKIDFFFQENPILTNDIPKLSYRIKYILFYIIYDIRFIISHKNYI